MYLSLVFYYHATGNMMSNSQEAIAELIETYRAELSSLRRKRDSGYYDRALAESAERLKRVTTQHEALVSEVATLDEREQFVLERIAELIESKRDVRRSTLIQELKRLADQM